MHLAVRCTLLLRAGFLPVEIKVHALTVADAGSHEGGFHYHFARVARAKFLGHAHKLVKATPIFERFREKLLALPVNRSVFDRDCC